MVRKRAVFDPLKKSNEPRWLVVRNMHGAVLEQHQLAPDSDVHDAFIRALAAYVDDGWQVEDFSSSHPCAFCNRGSERRMITISPTDPRDDRGLQYGPAGR